MIANKTYNIIYIHDLMMLKQSLFNLIHNID